jgi:hypothetical protein
MPITRSYTNAFSVIDYTQELALVPTKWSLLNDIGLFSNESLTTNTVTFEEQNQTLALVTDQYRGAKPRANSDDVRKLHAYPIAHYPVVDALKPEDLQGVRAYGSQDVAETKAAAIARKVAKISRAFDDALELARFRTLSTLQVYAPNGTISGNFATDFGITQKSVNFVLGTAGTDVVAKVEEVIAHMQDNAQGTTVAGVVGYCSPAFFAAFISHPKIVAAYQYYASSDAQNVLRNRAGNSMSMFRQFVYAGVTLIEVRGAIGGVNLVNAGEAIFVPTGTEDVFVTYYGPANKMDLVNTVAEQRYLWTFDSPKGESTEIEAEANWINVIRQPALIVKATNT